MGRTFDFLGVSLSRLLYASQLVALLLALLFVASPLDGFASVPFALLFASLVTVAAVGLWRTTTDSDGRNHSGTPEDITYDPFADPGQAAKHRWEKAVRRLPGRDNDQD